MEELNELKNLVIQSLENNGSLSNIRAQIRSSVFKVIDAQESNNPKKVSQFHWENLKVQKLAESKEGQEQLSLIKESLQFYNMDYTLNIFNSEANLKDEIKRNDLLSKNGLTGKVPEDKPVLFHIFQQFMKNSGAKPSKPPTIGKDLKSSAPDSKALAPSATSLTSEKQAISKAQEVLKKNEVKNTKVADMPAQKKVLPKDDQELEEQILKNQSRKMGDSEVFGDSQGYDMSVDSLQLQEYDYFENVSK